MVSNQERIVKFIYKHNATPKQIDEFNKEAFKFMQLDHPNIITPLEIYDDPFYDCICLPMKMIKGFNLFDKLLTLDCLSESASINYISTIVNALVYMHSKGVIMQRLYPSNLFIEYTGKIEVLMMNIFTLGRNLLQHDKMHLPSEAPLFDSPETHKSGAHTLKSDIWSLGIICYILMTGEPPYLIKKGDNIPKIVMETVITSELLAQHKILKLYPAACDFISKCLNHEPHKRSSIEELQKHDWLNTDKIVNISFDVKLQISKGIKQFYLGNNLEQEVYRFLSRLVEITDTEKKLKILFNSLDTSKNGEVSKIELWKGIKKHKIQLTLNNKKKFMAAFDAADSNKSGCLSYSEFIALCMDKDELVKEDCLREAFAKYDEDHNGYLSMNELSNIKDSHQIFNNLDTNHDSKVTIDEFITYFRSKS